MTLHAFIVLSLLGLMLFQLVSEKLRPGIILLCILTILLLFGVVNTREALSGFSNQGMLTVFLLFFVSEGVRQTGALNRLINVMLPKKKGFLPFMLLKITLPISVISAFLNNTPVVVIFAPFIKKWADKIRVPASKFLIPLSYATIFGGMCTLIGTSTNLVMHGLMLDNGFTGLTMFELGKVGVFVAIAGLLYIAFISPLLLPGKRKNGYTVEPKKYYYNAFIPANSPFVGKTVRNGHFPEHSDIIVTIIERGNQAITATAGETILEPNDKLIILGTDTVLEQLITITGISIEDYENIDAWFKKEKLIKVEVVLSDSSPAIGQTLNQFNFYKYYRGIVAAINRNGEKITTHTGDVVLEAGDCLVVLATPVFTERWSDRRDFYLLSDKGEIDIPASNPRMWIALGLVVLMVFGAAISQYLPRFNNNRIDMFLLAATVTTIMFYTKIIQAKNYTKSVSWDVLITIACAFGISKGVQNSGLADFLATEMIGIAKNIGPVAVLAVIFVFTVIFTEVITNNAAVAIMFPIALAAATQMQVNPHPFFIGICIAASASFSTPIGYQTNLIVQAVGEYRFNDFLKVGLPLNILVMIVSIILIPIFWSF